MKINDDMLSSFLDDELAAHEREAVLKALEEDPALAARLAALADMDAAVKRQGTDIDALTMPAAVMDLLTDEAPARKGAGVVPFSGWQRAERWLQPPMAMAASLVIVVAGAALLLLSMEQGMSDTERLLTSLDSSLSGEPVQLREDASLLSRLSFVAEDGRYCRQFQLSVADRRTENIACRDSVGWTVVASTAAADNGLDRDEQAYRPASNARFLDEVLEDMMPEAPLSLEEERELIRRSWQ